MAPEHWQLSILQPAPKSKKLLWQRTPKAFKSARALGKSSSIYQIHSQSSSLTATLVDRSQAGPPVGTAAILRWRSTSRTNALWLSSEIHPNLARAICARAPWLPSKTLVEMLTTFSSTQNDGGST